MTKRASKYQELWNKVAGRSRNISGNQGIKIPIEKEEEQTKTTKGLNRTPKKSEEVDAKDDEKSFEEWRDKCLQELINEPDLSYSQAFAKTIKLLEGAGDQSIAEALHHTDSVLSILVAGTDTELQKIQTG